MGIFESFITRVPIRLALAASLCLSILAAPPEAAGESAAFMDAYIARTWNRDSGLPDNSVRSLVAADDGYLWIGTAAGLVRFDGVRFATRARSDASSLSERSVLSLCEDFDGVLWVGTDGGGLSSYEGGVWRQYGPREGMLNGHIRAVAVDWKGTIWAGTEYGLHRLYGGEISVFGLDDGLADDLVTSLAFDAYGRLWAGTGWGGLARFEDGVVRVYGGEVGLTDPRILSLCADPGGAVWIGTMRGLFLLEPREEMIRSVPGTDRYPITAIAPGPGGRVLVGTMVEGLKVLDTLALIDVFPESELGDCHVLALLTDANGGVWIGTESKGLIQLRTRTVGSISVADGLPEGSVYALLEDEDGTLWIGTENSGLCRFRGGAIDEVLDRSNGLTGDMVRVLSRDRFGRLIVGTMDGGISIIESGRIVNHTLGSASGKRSYPIENMTAILTDRSGAVWIGTGRGLSRSADGRVEHALPVGGFEEISVRTLHEGDGGSLYAGGETGVWRLSGSFGERVVSNTDSLAIDCISLHEDLSGALWMGTNGGGLVRLANGTAAVFTTLDGLPGNFIYSITEDDSALLWISCEAGIFSIMRDSLAAYAEGNPTLLAPTVCDDADGAPSARCNGLCQPAFCFSRSGRRYYPTKGGIAVLERDAGRGEPAPPRVLVESMLAGDVEVRMDDDIELPHETDLVEFRFTALHCRAPEKCRFLYTLKGRDEGFIPLHPGRERAARYRKLPPGEYEFAVWAVGNGGLRSERPASVSFAVAQPFYRSWAFALILSAAVACASGAAAAVTRRRRISRQKLKYSTSTISGERIEKATAGLNALMAEERIYLDPDLNLNKLARRLNIHANHLSRIINEQHGVSFNDYINRHRIAEAQKRLADQALRDKSILDIMYDVGFYSKSTFNTAFRKFAGTSPSGYRKKHR